MNFFEFWNQYKWRILSVALGIVFAMLLFTIGFWKTLLLFVIVGAAFSVRCSLKINKPTIWPEGRYHI